MKLLSIAVLGLSAAATAQTPATTAKAPARPVVAKPAPLTLAPGVKRGVMSPEGRTIAARIYGAPDARIAQIQNEITTLRQERALMIASPPIDLARLEPMLRQEEILQTELRARSNDRLMLLLRSLPDADRVVVLQNMANPARPQSSAKPVSPASPVN